MTLPMITAKEVDAKVKAGALLVDIRSRDEYAREHIAVARNIPLDNLSAHASEIAAAPTVIYHCRSGMRTQSNAGKLAALRGDNTFILEGGIDAWKAASLPIVEDKSQPLELQRQVQIGAGSIALLGFILGITVSPGFHVLSGFVGAGLVVAGLTGFCGMARILMKMPWNK